MRGSALTTVAIGLNGVGALAFWTFVAGRDAAAEVGGVQETYTAVLVATYLTSLGLPVAVARFCPDRSTGATTFFRVSLVATCLSSVVGAVGVVALGHRFGVLGPLDALGAVEQVLMMSLLVAGMSCAVLVEVRLMALRAWNWVLLRVVGVVLGRFALVLVVPGTPRWTFLLAAGLPAATGFLGALALAPRSPQAETSSVSLAERQEWTRYSAVNFVSLLGSQGPQFLVPLAVAVSVSGADFAPFYLAWGATTIVFVIPHMLGQALVSEASHLDTDVDALRATTIRLNLGATIAIALGSVAAAPVLVVVLGEDYRSLTTLLPTLVVAAVPWSITATTLATARARADGRATLGVTAGYLGVVLACVATGAAMGGVTGAALGWLAANLVVAAACTVSAHAPLGAATRTDRLEVAALVVDQ